MTDRLQEIRERLEASPPGSWEVYINPRHDVAYLLRRLQAAEALIQPLLLPTCQCGARVESPASHPHLGGCPVGATLWAWEKAKEGP